MERRRNGHCKGDVMVVLVRADVVSDYCRSD